MPTAPTVDDLSDLYSNAEACAKLIGLTYVEPNDNGFGRARHGKGFRFIDKQAKAIADAKTKQRITDLVIPPAWEEVWICASDKGHVLATGVDEKGRKQYIYHPKWRTMRDLIKFYRMLIFGKALPKIRRDIDAHLKQRSLSKEKVMAIMLWILDNSYIRIGNDAYFVANESVGLTTLTDRNVIIAGPVVTLSFKGKSGKNQQITFENAGIAKVLDELRQVKGARLFRYQDAAKDWHSIDSEDINHYLHDLTAAQISAKDFRTWGGTLMAFMHLLKDAALDEDKKPEKVVIEAIDQAAAVLGNTRTVARSSYVHPHILQTYGHKAFDKYYAKAKAERKIAGLDTAESELYHFLEELFKDEFNLIKNA
jgi:DNA topoisomerase-1